MKAKKEIAEKLTEAEIAHEKAGVAAQGRLSAVIATLHWVLDHKIMTGPIDPVKGE